MGIRAILLDVDGTIVDSNRAHAYAWVDALSEHGFKADFSQVLSMIGMGGDKLLPRATGGVTEDSDVGKRIVDRRSAIFKERYLPVLRPTPGARELLTYLKREGFVVTVASSAKRDELEGLLRIVGAGDLLPRAASSDDADESKPDPDIVHAALRKVAVASEEAVMIGDTPYDVEAAHRAGVRIIALRCGGWDDVALREADATYDDPADLVRHVDRSILAAHDRPRDEEHAARAVTPPARFGMRSADPPR
jgi:HAD superfamily hydrolase (TIGR01509 family)